MTTQTIKERPYSRKEVVDILQSALASVKRNSAEDTALHDSLASLATYIEGLRSELAQLRSIEISHNHIPTAHDELDAVVAETAKATGTIMDACDKIQAAAAGLPPENEGAIGNAVTEIYEACSFQDITGQRITKVIKALKNIEKKVADILEAFGHAHPASNQTEAPAVKKDDGGLLNGPQLGGPAVNQDEIDRLLASFDNP